MSNRKFLFTSRFELMKNVSFINPIPKRVVRIMNSIMLIFICGANFCTELKAIPEDWPSTDGNFVVMDINRDAMQLSCIGTVQLSLDQSGMATLTPQMLLVDYYPSYARFKVVVNQNASNKVSCADIGKVITATVIDTTNGMMCWSSIVVEDKLKPQIICRNDTISCTNDPFAVDYSAYVSISDNCDNNVTSYYDLTFDLFYCSNSRYSSVVHLKWTAIDDHGNTNTCNQDIYFKKSSVDSIEFPEDTTVYCPNVDLNLTGVPTLFGDTVSSLCQLLVTHVDDSIIVCGGMMKIRRLWTVIDWCNRSMKSQTQEIVVADTTKPDIQCPNDVTLYANFATCKMDYQIQDFNVSDACSPAALILKVVRLDSAYLLHPGQTVSLGVGTHTLNYIAIDPCGNSDTCTAYVLVKDKVSPSLICPPALVVSLSPVGYVQLTADFIAGKGLVTDNCCLDTILVRRMTPACSRPQDTTFRDLIEFCCDDIGNNLMIVLKAIDCSGNSNFCMIQIMVQDKNPVTAKVCPPDTILSCDQNYLDLSITGKSYAISTCLDTVLPSFYDNINLDSCGQGLITRTFIITYPNGSIDSSCKQRIGIINNYVFSPGDIVWPGDTSLLKCTSYAPDTIMSMPLLTKEDCGSVYFSHQDLPIQFTIDSCAYFDRVWTAYSACSKQTVRDTQVISILSLDHSTLVVPADTTLANDFGTCSAFVNLQSALITGCGRGIQITNSYNNGGEDASGVYPVGTTLVIFTATDLCSTITDTTKVIVQDLESPNIQCKNININIQPNDSLKLTARSLLNSYSDNCTISDSLHISFTLHNFTDTIRYITCADVQAFPQIFNFTIIVEDSFGNVDSCNAIVTVDDPNGYCLTAFRIGDVGGYIRTGNKNPMEGVKVDLLGLNKSLYSDGNGYFVFNDIITNHEYTISPNYNKNWLEGLTTQDIVMIQRHILGIEPFDHPYKWIAADLDRNGRVTSADIVWLRKLILGKENAVPHNQSWRFVNNSYKFLNPSNPLDEAFEEQTQLKGFWKDTVVHFDAIKTGDVSSVNGVVALNDRLRKSDLIIENKPFKEGEIFKVDILLDKETDLEGIQMSFDLNPEAIELLRISEYINQSKGRNLDQDEFNYNGHQLELILLVDSKEGAVKFQGKMLSLWFKARKQNSIREVFTPGTLLSNEIYPKADVPVKILYTYKELSNYQAELANWYVDPNPFNDKCYIEFQSTQNDEITFSVYDLTGKMVITRSASIVKGLNKLVIDANDLPIAGTYLYHIRLGDHAYHGKIVRSN